MKTFGLILATLVKHLFIHTPLFFVAISVGMPIYFICGRQPLSEWNASSWVVLLVVYHLYSVAWDQVRNEK